MSAITRRNDRHGQALAEFAFVIPIFLAMLLAIFDVGHVIWANNTVEQAAREAARYAIVHGANTTPSATKQDIRNVALNSAVAAGSSVTVTVCYAPPGTSCSGDTDAAGASDPPDRGTAVTVVVHSPVPLVAGAFLGLGTFQVSGASTMLVNN